jgi:photosystem II stability/assembly factor-like uncharacterized protein
MQKGRRRCTPFILVLFASLLSGLTAGAQRIGQSVVRPDGVTDMFPLSPGVGGAIVRGRLLWTNDNGAVWTDITPPGPADQGMVTRFFLDADHGWIVFVDGTGSWDSQTPVRLVRTVDGGRTWSPLRFDKSSYADVKDIAMIPRTFWFVDAQHGWFQWQFQTSSAFSIGSLFSTSDGGTTWTELPRPPSAKELRFHTLQDGWIVGDPDDELDVTHDGGRTWQPTKSVSAPSNCSKCLGFYSTPKFQDRSNGTFEVHFVDYNSVEGHEVNAIYVTHDGGNSWQNTEALERDGQDLMENRVVTSLVGNHAIRIFFSRDTNEIQIRNRGTAIYSSLPAGAGSIANLQFVDDMNGWMMSAVNTCAKVRNPATDGSGLSCLQPVIQLDLFATTDGGKTFIAITPHLSPATSQ